MVNDVDWGKLPICPSDRSLAILRAEPSSSKSGVCGRKEWWILSTKYFFRFRGFLHAVKYYDMQPPALLPLQKKMWYGILSPLKIHRLGHVWPANCLSNGKQTSHYTTEATTLSERQRFREFGNSMLRRMLGPNSDEETGDRRQKKVA
jgi:hypothetical protein